MNGWQPIETVPRDGTPVLGWIGRGGPCVRYVIVRNWGAGLELMELSSVVFQPDVTITHWMPIPAGPEPRA